MPAKQKAALQNVKDRYLYYRYQKRCNAPSSRHYLYFCVWRNLYIPEKDINISEKHGNHYSFCQY